MSVKNTDKRSNCFFLKQKSVLRLCSGSNRCFAKWWGQHTRQDQVVLVIQIAWFCVELFCNFHPTKDIVMKTFIRLALATAALCAATLTYAAGAVDTPRVDQRQDNQAQRIDAGVKSGQLTMPETRKLEKQQTRVRMAEHRAKADGTVTTGERRHLNHMQNRASRHIYRKKHNHRTAN
jgi:hypothetical protein